jgi:hypothetical protein
MSTSTAWERILAAPQKIHQHQQPESASSPRRKRSITALVDYKNILMNKGDIARLSNANSRRPRRGRRGRPRTPVGCLAPAGSSVPVGSVPPYKTWMNDCLVLDLACLSGATNVPHSGGPAGCSREHSRALWASIYQSRKHSGTKLGRMSKHVPDIRSLIPRISVAMTSISAESSSYTDIWRS